MTFDEITVFLQKGHAIRRETWPGDLAVYKATVQPCNCGQCMTLTELSVFSCSEAELDEYDLNDADDWELLHKT